VPCGAGMGGFRMQILDILQNISNEVSKYIQGNYYTAQAKFLKQDNFINVSGDLQKGIDDIVNEKIIDLIKAAQLPVIVISEETGIIKLHTNPTHFLLLDPIDGSNNVRPWFTPHPNLVISMGYGEICQLKELGLDAIDVCIVKEIFSENTYYSIKGQGAFFQNTYLKHQLQTSKVVSLTDGPIIGLDMDKKSEFSADLVSLISRNILVRRLGSTILDLCQVAAGQYDAYISTGNRLKVTDVCQPYALIKQSGGFIELTPYYKGEVFSDNFLYECLSNQNLLRDIRFKIIVSSSEQLFQDIKGLLSGYQRSPFP